MPVDPDGQNSDDERLFELLDRYVQSLHESDVMSKSVLLERHPELAPLMHCLEELESLAPSHIAGEIPRESELDVAVDSDAKTVPDLSNTPAGPDAPTWLGADLTAETEEKEPDQFEEPKEFGKYLLLREEGRGGMGVVYLARQQDLERPVALKMILSSQLASKDEIRRFYAEAKAAGSLRHPNIVAIHEVGEIGGQHYFAMDYVEGDDLAMLLRDGPIEPERATELVLKIARAVHFLHENGLVHRDLKPSNILVDRSGIPFVTDFGLAKVFDQDGQHTRTGTIVGTPSYMSPEQAAGKTSQVTPRSDVYSLGAILYEMLTGRPPFKRDNPLDTLVEVLEGEPTMLSKVNADVPRDLELICHQCLEKDPEARYQSAAALADDLERFLKCESIEARPTGISQRLKRWARREPSLASHLGAFAAAMFVVQLKYWIADVELDYHLAIMIRFAIWIMISIVFQRLMNIESLAHVARYGWTAADIVMLTALLYVAEHPIGPLLGGYALLIAASGLFFQVRLVWFATFMTLTSYAALVMISPDPSEPRHYPIIFAVILAVLGFVVAYQVHRVRVLSRYYDERRP